MPTPPDFETRLQAWKQAEAAAIAAEAQVARMGQGAADPRVADLLLSSVQLRTEANAMLADLIASVGSLDKDPKSGGEVS